MKENFKIPVEYEELIADRKAMIDDLLSMEKEFKKKESNSFDNKVAALVLIRIKAKKDYINFITDMLNDPEKAMKFLEETRDEKTNNLLDKDETDSFPSD
jgi:hypothetical protein